MNDTLKIIFILLVGVVLLSVILAEISVLVRNRLPKLLNRFTSNKCPHCSKGTLYHDKTNVNAAEMDCYICDNCNTEFI